MIFSKITIVLITISLLIFIFFIPLHLLGFRAYCVFLSGNLVSESEMIKGVLYVIGWIAVVFFAPVLILTSVLYEGLIHIFTKQKTGCNQ